MGTYTAKAEQASGPFTESKHPWLSGVLRFVVPSVLTVGLFIAAGWFFLYPQMESVIMHGEMELVKQITHSGWSILDQYEQRARAGEMTRDEAQAQAIEVIRRMRFGENKMDYLWIINEEPRMILHPYRPDLEGQDVTNYTDPRGNRLFFTMKEIAETEGQGYLQYLWQLRGEEDRIVPKISFVEVYEPWGWIIGSGVYLHEVEESIAAWLRRAMWVTGAILMFVIALSAYNAVSTLRVERARLAATRALRERTKELARSNRELEQFASVASHDLQEPLRKVSSFLGLIEERYDDRLDDEGRKFIAFAVSGAKRMKRMIEDLLDYSRVETRGKEFQPCDCTSVVTEAIRDLDLQIAESGARIRVGPLPAVQGDFGQLRQLFVNLLQNAIKYRGDGPPEIEITARREDSYWRFTVRDNGVGIAPDYHEKIFMIFQRVNPGDSPPGTGIGLALCKRIVERHGGVIEVKSETGEGATFSFTLCDGGK